jgi:dephospho-CoA kinase
MVGLKIGLTGGIGSGKSTVARLLVECGAVLVDTDAIARALTQAGGAAMQALAAEFGPGMLAADGALDRERMRALVFAEPAAKGRLEAILHPMIAVEATRQAALAHAGAGERLVVFDVPLLTESAHWRARVDRVLVVDCTEATQVERVMQRAGWAEEAVLRVIAQQSSRQSRRAVADAVIFNEGLSPAALGEEVRALWGLWNNPPP